jgi:hypothetical protein
MTEAIKTSRSSALYATESDERDNAMPNEVSRKFWFLSSGCKSIGSGNPRSKRERNDDDGTTHQDWSADEDSEDSNTFPAVKKTIRFFVSEVCLSLPDGTLEPIVGSGDVLTTSTRPVDGRAIIETERRRLPPPIFLGKAEQASQLTVSAFSYEATKRLRLFVSNNPALFGSSDSAGLSRDAVLRTINEVARGLGDTLSRAAGAIVTGHVIALSRILDGNAMIPKEFLSTSLQRVEPPSTSTTVTTDERGSIPGSPHNNHQLPRRVSVEDDERLQAAHLMPLIVSAGGWCTSAQLKEEIAMFLQTQELNPIIRMLLVPMAPLQER